MKQSILIFLFFLPFISFAEYNGVHLEFEIQLNNGNKILGYKYVAHGKNTEAYKKYLEENCDVFLINQFTYEPGVYGYYKSRLQYNYNNTSVYKLIEPIEIDLNDIKSLSISEMIIASYAIQIVGDYKWEDRFWMKNDALFHYSEYEEMCSYDVFIHKAGDSSNETIKNLKSILDQAELKLKMKEKELENTEVDSDSFDRKLEVIFKERNQKVSEIIKSSKSLKSITIGLCTC